MVASALGVTVSRISQLISDPDFSAAVSELRYKFLLKNNDRDNSYDSMEEALQQKLKDLLPFMVKPFEVLKAIQIINAAKRRGVAATDTPTERSNVVQLSLPVNIFNQNVVQNIQVNINNQVTRAGDQDLITIQSGQMDKMLVASRVQGLLIEQKRKESQHVPKQSNIAEEIRAS